MCASQRIGAPAPSAARAALTRRGWTARSRVRSGCPQACTIRTATFSASAGSPVRSVSSRMVAKDSR
jgi:hypothetical protein